MGLWKKDGAVPSQEVFQTSRSSAASPISDRSASSAGGDDDAASPPPPPNGELQISGSGDGESPPSSGKIKLGLKTKG